MSGVWMVVAVLAASACQDATLPGASDGGGDDAVSVGDGPGLDAGVDAPPASGSIWTSDATKMVAEDRADGFSGPSPVGSGCPRPHQATFTLTVATNGLAWHECRPASGGLYQFEDGARVLTDPEMSMMQASLAAITLTHRNACGADKGTLLVTVTTPQGETAYYDDFYSCNGPPRIYVENIDQLFQLVRRLAK